MIYLLTYHPCLPAVLPVCSHSPPLPTGRPHGGHHQIVADISPSQVCCLTIIPDRFILPGEDCNCRVKQYSPELRLFTELK